MKAPWTYLTNKLRLDELSPGFKKYLLNTGWMFGEKFLRLIAGLFVGAAVARYLGPSRYGVLSYAISMVTFIVGLTVLGLDQLVVRELVRNPEKKDQILGTGFILKLSAAALVLAGLLIALKVTGGGETSVMICIITGGLLFDAFGVIDYFFQSQVNSKLTVWGQMVSLSIVALARVYLVLTRAELVWFAWTYALDYVLMGLGSLYFYSRQHYGIFKWKMSWPLAKAFLRDCWPLIFATLSIVVYMKIDQVMIKWMMGDAATGQYGVAVRLCELWNFIPVAICASVFPAILNAKMKSEELYLARLQKLYDLMVGISVAIAVPMTFLSNVLIRFLFGEAFAAAGPILNLYIWSSVFVFLGVATGKWLISENMQGFIMIVQITAAIINILLNLVLIKRIGLPGAAIATLAAYIFASYFSFLFTKKTRSMFIYCTRSLNLFGSIKRNFKFK